MMVRAAPEPSKAGRLPRKTTQMANVSKDSNDLCCFIKYTLKKSSVFSFLRLLASIFANGSETTGVCCLGTTR